jgi:hypothetical protein
MTKAIEKRSDLITPLLTEQKKLRMCDQALSAPSRWKILFGKYEMGVKIFSGVF